MLVAGFHKFENINSNLCKLESKFLNNDKRIIYCTKSSYRKIIYCKMPATCSLLWRSLWKLKIYRRIKVFYWRLLFNYLPTRRNISVRINIPDMSCCFCLSFFEPQTICIYLLWFFLIPMNHWSWTSKLSLVTFSKRPLFWIFQR